MTHSPLRIAQLTDTHLFADDSQTLLGIPTAQSLQAVLTKIQQLQPQPDVLLITGDLSQDETSTSYQHVHRLVAPLEIPTYWIRGNHDQLPNLQAFLNTAPISSQRNFQGGGWNVLLLDSALAQRVHGQLSAETLDWLANQLQAHANLPTLIALHHPPVAIQSAWMDEIKLQNAADLFAILDQHPQVKLVVFGHIHQEFDGERHGVRYLGTPSTCVQFKPRKTDFTLDSTKPGFRLLELYPDGSFHTRVERVTCSYQLDLTASGY